MYRPLNNKHIEATYAHKQNYDKEYQHADIEIQSVPDINPITSQMWWCIWKLYSVLEKSVKVSYFMVRNLYIK